MIQEDYSKHNNILKNDQKAGMLKYALSNYINNLKIK